MTEIYKGWHFSYLIFQGLFFSATITLWKKGIYKLPKNEPENIPYLD